MIWTTDGGVAKQDFGRVLIHEHIGCISNDMLHIFGKDWLDKDKLIGFASEILKGIAKEYGVGLFVDGTPVDLGRDVALLKAVSEKSGIPIVVSTGLYYYPSLYTSGHSEKEIASWFIKEWETGAENTGIKPGILKSGSDRDGITRDNEKRLRALSVAQKETGLPMYVHCSHQEGLVESQIEVMLSAGGNPEKIIIGHCAQRPECDYFERIMDKGFYIGMDQAHCTRHIDKVGTVLARLCEKGYRDKILLGNDLCMYSDFATRATSGLERSVKEQIDGFGHIFTVVYKSFLEAGGKPDDWEKIFRENSVNVLDV